MVKMLRVDERMLHGQVAVTWVANVNASSILIANDEVMKNEMAKVALKLAKPSGVNLAIRDVQGGIELLKDPRAEKIEIFVIVRTVEDALRMVEATGGIIKHINIGGIKKKEGGRLVAGATYVTDNDIAVLRKLEGLVDELEFRMVASDPKKSLKSVVG